IARGLAAAGLDAGEVDSGSGPGGESAGTSLRELFDPSSHLAERGSYRVPSYDNDGEPTELPLLASREDQLFTQESRLEGRLVAIFPGWRSISVSSSRYALEPNLARALTWGQLLFGARSFVVLQGSAGYFALATDETVHSADVRLRPAGEIGGRAAYGSSGNFAWPDDIRDDQGELYTLRTLVTVEGDRLFPPRPEQFAAFFRELDATPAAERAVSATAARSFVFGEIDRLLAAEDPRGAADRLVELDANAFALVPWEVKELYLEALLAVWTGSKEEVAVVELLKSLTSRSELAAMLEKLKEAHRFGDLVDDLDDQLWSLLVVMGERFGKAEPWSFGRSVALLQDAGLLPKDLAEAIARVSQGPAGFSVGLDSLAEIEEAAYGFARFVDSSVESLWMLVSHPEKLIEGVGQLVRLLVAYHLALAGHKPSIQLIHGLLSQIGKQILAALAGIEVLGVGERVARRVRWALIWEIASWVVG
ncbi:MAG TPA: hypothetical protein PK413_16440, partial [Thermoanaerobaculia bacterium]|nr:hypothetical protein [Thermoanaerobaculia bacterium]